jgi:hypothetical protein
MAVRAALVLIAATTIGCGRINFEAPGGDAAGGAATGDAGGDGGPLPIAFVQATPPSIVGMVSSTTITFATRPAAGNLIVVYAWSYAIGQTGFASGGVTDTAGNPYTLAVTRATTATGCDTIGSAAIAIYYSLPITPAGGSHVVSVAPTGPASQEVSVIAVEYQGLVAADQITSKTTSVSVSPSAFDSGTTAMTAADHELLAAVGNPCSGSPGTIGLTDTAGFTVRAVATTTATTQPGIAADRIVTTRGTYADAWNLTFGGGGTRPALGAITTFR